jgi:hypothetical protein
MPTSAPLITVVTRDGLKELAEQFRGDLELPPKLLSFPVEHACEGQRSSRWFSSYRQTAPADENTLTRLFSSAATKS